VFNAPQILFHLVSTDGVMQGSTRIELLLLRYALAIFSVSFFLVVLFFGRVRDNVQFLVRDFRGFMQSGHMMPVAVPLKMLIFWNVILWSLFFGLISTIKLSNQYFNSDWFRRLAYESGFWETLTAGCFLVGSIIYFRVIAHYWRKIEPRWLGLPAILIAILFFLGFGEEISWGQHFFKFETPEYLAAVNTQNEFNFHNIGGYWINNLTTAFVFFYGICFPLAYLWFVDVRYVVTRLFIAVPHLSCVPISVIAMTMDEREFFKKIWGQPSWRLSEAREVIIGLIVVISL
jgi:hypothetical protein